LQNVLRTIRKRIRRVVSASDDTPVSGPVGFDEASQELSWMTRHDLSLPRLENETALVLAAGAVLREECWPRPRIAGDDGDGGIAPHAYAHTIVGQQRTDGSHYVLDDIALLLVEKDSKHIRTPAASEVAVAEIHPQHVGIG
jgi:hypothetical protein